MAPVPPELSEKAKSTEINKILAGKPMSNFVEKVNIKKIEKNANLKITDFGHPRYMAPEL